MSDEEDTTILLTGKKYEREKKGLKILVHNEIIIKNDQDVGLVHVPFRNNVILMTTVATLSGISFGYDMGFGTNMLSQVQGFYNLNCMEQYMINSSWLIGAILASIVGGMVIDGCGRRWAMCCTACLVILGVILTAIANSYILLLCGRLVSGFAGTLSSIAQCVYAAEVCEPHSRGRGVSVHQLGVAVGLLLSGVAGVGDDIEWQVLVWLGGVPTIIQGLLAAFCLPRSPHFTLLQVSQSTQTKRPSMSCALGNLTETFVLAFSLVFFQQFCGHSSVIYYAPRLFVLLGVCPDIAPTVANITFGIIKVSATLLSLSVVDRVGRRPVLIVGATCMMTSIALLGVFSALEEGEIVTLLDESCGLVDIGGTLTSLPSDGSFHYSAGARMVSPFLPTGAPPPFPLLPTPVSLIADKKWAGSSTPCSESVSTPLSPGLHYLAMFTLLCYETSFTFGLGPVVWLLLVELFPAAARGRAVALTTSLHWLADFIIPATFIGIIDTFTLQGTFILYSLICLLCICFVFLFVPETKGKSLHQIVQELKHMSPKIRMYQNIQGLPCFNKNEWLLRKVCQYRQVSHSSLESTVI